MNQFSALRNARGRALVAAHRGTAGGAIFPNTALAALNAVRHGADIVELDVVRSVDGTYFSFHDGYELKEISVSTPITEMTAEEIAAHPYGRVFGHAGVGCVEEFFPLIDKFPETLINVDRSWRYWGDGFLEELNTHQPTGRFLLKSPPELESLEQLAASGVEMPYMPIVQTRDDIDLVKEFCAAHRTINLVGWELLAATPESPLADLQLIKQLQAEGYLVWLNALNLENLKDLFCGFDDNTSLVEGPEHGWGKLVAYGADIIQTDWPALVQSYLDS